MLFTIKANHFITHARKLTQTEESITRLFRSIVPLKEKLGPILFQLCPECGFQKEKTMPADACTYFYKCRNSETLLKPRGGDCCIFCTYGTVKCPPIQEGVSRYSK